MKGKQVIVLIRGLPGTGKTTLADILIELVPNHVHVENDHFRTTEDKDYVFSPDDYNRVRTASINAVKQLLSEGRSVVVSNVFTTAKSVNAYTKLGVPTLLLEMTKQYGSIYDVSKSEMDKMIARWDTIDGAIPIDMDIVSMYKMKEILNDKNNYRDGTYTTLEAPTRPVERRKKILLIGHKGSGKSVIGKSLSARLGIAHKDSSTYCFEHVVYPVLKDRYNYPDESSCLADKDNRREDWFNLIAEYNDVPDRLTREILADNDIYVGMRNRREFEGSKHHFDVIVWIDASKRVENESTKSMELTVEDAHYTLDNNGSYTALDRNIDRLIEEVIMATP